MSYWPTTIISSGTVKSQLMSDDGRTPVVSHASTDGDYHLGVTSIQSVFVSTSNHYATALPLNAVFYGTKETTLGVAGIQVMLKADQNMTVKVQQTGDGSNWDVEDSYTYLYSKGGASWTTQAVGSDYRVVVQNTGDTNATYTRLDTALCPIVEALPRALSANGNLRVGVEELSYVPLNSHAKISPMGNLRTTPTARLIGASFGDSGVIDASFWGSTAVGTASLTDTGNAISLATGAGASGGKAYLQSVRTGRYVAGQSNYFRSILYPPAVAGTNTRRWGAFNANDGYFFEHDGTTLSVVCRKGGSDANKISSGSFNGDLGASYTLSATATTFEIYWTNKAAWLLMDDMLLHKFTGSTATLTNTNALPCRSENVNAAGNTNANTLEVRSMTINRCGDLATQPILKNLNTASTNILKYGAGNLHNINQNIAGAGASRMIVYDGITPSALGSWGTYDTGITSAAPTWDFSKAPFFNGLLVILTGSPTADVNVIYE